MIAGHYLPERNGDISGALAAFASRLNFSGQGVRLKLLTKKLQDDHNIFFIGDRHKGSILSSDDGWRKMVEMLQSDYDGCKNNYVAEGGDDIEAIAPDDKRFSPEKLTEKLILAQIDDAIEERMPIKDYYLYKLEGNHERTKWRDGLITQTICQKLGVPYGTYTVKLTVNDKWGRLMYKIYDTHGHKGISSTADDPKRRQANLQLTLKRQLKFKAADCAVMIKHHVHKLIVCKPESELYLTDDGKKIQQGYTSWGQREKYIHPDARWYGLAGSFMKLYGNDLSGYAEVAEYDPVELGFLVLKVRDKQIVELKPICLDI